MENDSVFIIHGHDELTKERVARFVEHLGIQTIILHEKVSKGMTIIEKLRSTRGAHALRFLLPTIWDTRWQKRIRNKHVQGRT